MHEIGKVVEYLCLSCGTQGTKERGALGHVFCPYCGKEVLTFERALQSSA